MELRERDHIGGGLGSCGLGLRRGHGLGLGLCVCFRGGRGGSKRVGFLRRGGGVGFGLGERSGCRGRLCFQIGDVVTGGRGSFGCSGCGRLCCLQICSCLGCGSPCFLGGLGCRSGLVGARPSGGFEFCCFGVCGRRGFCSRSGLDGQ